MFTRTPIHSGVFVSPAPRNAALPRNPMKLEEDDERDDPDVRAAERDDVGLGAEDGEHGFREDEPEHGEGDRQEGAEDEALLEHVVRLLEVVGPDRARDEGDRARGDADHHAEKEEDELGPEPDRPDGGVRFRAQVPDHDQVDRRREGLEQVRDHDGPGELEHGHPPEVHRRLRGGLGHARADSPLLLIPLASSPGCSVRGFLPAKRLCSSRRDPVTEKGPGGGAPGPHARGFRGLQVLLAIFTASEVVGASLLVVSLPPSLALQEGSMFGAVRANFPTTHSTEHPAGGNFTAMTYLNQTSGPSSYLMMHVRASGFTFGYNYAFSHMTFFYDVSVRGAFARNIRPVGLEFRTNVTGSAIAIGFHNNWYQGPNVISDPQQTFGFWNNGTGTLTATLTNWGGSGPLYEFEYGANGQSDMRNYRYTQFIGFRATLTAWMLPPINVGVVMEISNIPKTLTLVPKGTAVTVYGYNETRFDPST